MLTRGNASFLFIGRESLALCRFDRRGRVIKLSTRPRPMSGELPELIEIAAKLDQSPLGKTWILADDLWTNRLAVGRDQLAGLTSAEVTRALAFEVESLSGQSAIDSDLGLRPLDGSRDSAEFWVVQVPHWVRDQAEEIIARNRGRLVGILHPAGVAARLGGESPLGWGELSVGARSQSPSASLLTANQASP